MGVAIIVYSSFMDIGGIPTSKFFAFKQSDLIIHFLMYFFLSVTLFIENKKSGNNLENKIRYLIILTLIIFGSLIEILQPFLSNRSCEFFDFIANVCGVISGYYLHFFALKLLKR